MKHNDLINELLELILEKKKKNRTQLFLVGIEGKGCSGKSCLSKSLKQRFNKSIPSQVASIDDFCNPRTIRYDNDVPLGLQVYKNNFDDDFFLNKVIKPAYTAQRLEFDKNMLDAASDRYTNHVKISLPEGGVLLVEGLHILKSMYAQYFGFNIFLYISNKEQLTRALVRDTAERKKDAKEIRYKYEHRFVPSYQHFLDHDAPLNKTDLFIDYEDIEMPVIRPVNEARRLVYEH